MSMGFSTSWSSIYKIVPDYYLQVMDKQVRNKLNQHAKLISEIRLETAELKKNLIRLSDLAESNRIIIGLMRRPLWKKILGMDQFDQNFEPNLQNMKQLFYFLLFIINISVAFGQEPPTSFCKVAFSITGEVENLDLETL